MRLRWQTGSHKSGRAVSLIETLSFQPIRKGLYRCGACSQPTLHLLYSIFSVLQSFAKHLLLCDAASSSVPRTGCPTALSDHGRLKCMAGSVERCSTKPSFTYYSKPCIHPVGTNPSPSGGHLDPQLDGLRKTDRGVGARILLYSHISYLGSPPAHFPIRILYLIVVVPWSPINEEATPLRPQ